MTEISYFLPWTNPVCLILIFVLSCIFFHWQFVFLRPLSKKGWKYVDYAWLALTAVGLITAASSLRRSQAAFLLPSSKDLMDTELKLLMTENQTAQSYACYSKLYSDQWRSSQSLMRELRQLCKWLEFEQVAMRDLEPATQYISSPEPNLRDASSKKILLNYRDISGRYNESVGKYKSLSTVADKRWSELKLEALSPVLLAFVLAIRVTKVTGELNDLKGLKSSIAELPSADVKVLLDDGPGELEVKSEDLSRESSH